MINWVLENMKKNVEICSLIDPRMNENIPAINQTNQTHDILEVDKFHNELRISDCLKTRFLLSWTD